MSLTLQGKIHRYKMVEYAKAIGSKASPNAIRAAKHLWLVLAEHYNDETGLCFPSIPTLMKLLEKSHGPTVASKNLLIELRLITVTENAKGGSKSCRYAFHFPRYEDFSHPVGRTVSPPIQRMGKYEKQNPNHPTRKEELSCEQDASTPVDRTQILIETLNKPYINPSKVYEEEDSKIRMAEEAKQEIKNFIKNGKSGIKILNMKGGM